MNAFVLNASLGKISECKQIFDLHPTIDISADDEYAFRASCENGHIEIAKWLLEIKPTINISADDDFAFRLSCFNGHIEVSKWLMVPSMSSLYTGFTSQPIS